MKTTGTTVTKYVYGNGLSGEEIDGKSIVDWIKEGVDWVADEIFG